MPITIASGPDWATIMTAFGTVGAVIAAVGIAIGSSFATKKLVADERVEADRRLREQLEHSDEQLRKQQQHSDQQLQEERTAADERLQKQLHEAEKLEQRSQAAAVEVLAFFSAKPGENVISDPQNPSGVPVVIVVNRGKYAITDLDARLSPDGRIVTAFSMRQNLVSMRQNAVDPAVLPQHWTRDVLGRLGEVYLGTIAPGAAMRFEDDAVLVSTLRTSYPIIRWRDHWQGCWEYNKGQVYPCDVQSEWLPQRPEPPVDDDVVAKRRSSASLRSRPVPSRGPSRPEH